MMNQEFRRPHWEREAASRPLHTLAYLMRAVCDGGQASDLYLSYLHDQLVALLKELGGFDDLLDEHLHPRQ